MSGLVSRHNPDMTAAICIVDPMSMAAAPGFMRVRFCGMDELVFGMASPPLDWEGLGRASSSFS